MLVSHDAADGIWRLVGASDADSSTGRIGHLHHAVDEDQTLIDVLDLAGRSSAARAGVGQLWTGPP
ncbi:hypothetical protein AB0J80_32285 [Actinoplanes sp. NPDC049548]|uniref:hypothetical protein n=1 Tax=Actinoplanes sp. NPDC049548 TaxID=3155152 RepID=UPI00341FF270